MYKTLNAKWFVLVALLFVLIQAVLIYFEQFWFFLLPFAIFVIWAAFFRLDKLLLFITFFVPLSLNLEDLEIGGLGFYFPTEPLLFGVFILFIFKLLSGKSVEKKIYFHPVSVVIYVYLIWMFVTSITSEYPVVSLKFLIAKLWYIAPIYFLMSEVFKDKKNIRYFFLAYLIPLSGVVIYTIIRHASYAFGKQAGHWVMEPFFKDHTSYGAVLALFFPVVLGLMLQKRTSNLFRLGYFVLFVIITAGLVFSLTRAAWLSVVIAGVVFILMQFRVKLKTLLMSTILMGSFLWMAQDQLIMMLSSNDQDSSANLTKHVESMTNISTDASNLERLNRWNCAIAMFEDRPWVGWGPGTYQFVYAPYQRSSDLTIISTNNADGGNAHSDYLGPLSEQGIFGPFIYLALILSVSTLAFRLYYTLRDKELRMYVIVVYLGLFTYFIHGILNNYLDTDKLSVPFWGFISILVTIDLYHRKTANKLLENEGKK